MIREKMRIRHIFIGIALLAVCCAGYYTITSGVLAPRDDFGKQPRDVFTDFLDAVNKHDYQIARSYCTAESIRTLETNLDTTFDEFCRKYLEAESYSLSQFKKEKSGFYSAMFTGSVAGTKTESLRLAVVRINGQWTLKFPF